MAKNAPTITVDAGDLVLCNDGSSEAYYTACPSTWSLGGLSGTLRAFPNAEGLAALTRGAAGYSGAKSVAFVDNTNNSGAGSLREAVEGTGKEGTFVIFRTSGIINLTSPLTVKSSYITLCGQTSPSGTCTAGNVFQIGDSSDAGENDIVIRHMRFRPGYFNVALPEDAEGFRVWNSDNIMLDHCSVSWAGDENMSITTYGASPCTNITLSKCIIGEGLTSAVYPDTEENDHGYGSLVNGDYAAGNSVDVIKCLYVHCNSRMPQFTGSGYYSVISSVIYNYWKTQNTMIIPDGSSSGRFGVNFIGNYVKEGPDSNASISNAGNASLCQVQGNGTQGSITLTPFEMLHLDNNYGPDRLLDSDPEFRVANGYSFAFLPNTWEKATPFTYTPTISRTTLDQTNLEAFLTATVADCGATLPVRDSADTSMVADATNGTGGLVTNKTYPTDWPTYGSDTFPTDSDGDGIPDSFWTFKGISAQSWDAVAPDGYLWIENFANSISGFASGDFTYASY